MPHAVRLHTIVEILKLDAQVKTEQLSLRLYDDKCFEERAVKIQELLRRKSVPERK